MFKLFQETSDKIDKRVKELTGDNEKLIRENKGYRERLLKLIDDQEGKDEMLRDSSSKWIEISNDMKAECIKVKIENEKLRAEMNGLIESAIKDKNLITTSFTNERKLREILHERTKEFERMHAKTMEQAKYTTAIVKDMKGMRADLDGIKNRLKQSEYDRLKAEQASLQYGKEKLEAEKTLATSQMRVLKLEQLCRALQTRAPDAKEGGEQKESEKKTVSKDSNLSTIDEAEKNSTGGVDDTKPVSETPS